MNLQRGSGALAHALPDMAVAGGSGRWSDFGVRLASASVLGPIALLCLWRGGWAWLAFIEAALCGLGFEWARLASLPRGWRVVYLPFMLIFAVALALYAGYAAGFLVLFVFTAVIGWQYGWFAAMGIPYAGIGGIALLWLRLQPKHGLYDAMFLVVTVWGTDIGAYLVGRVVGGAKLAPRISPGKTWSGSIGGLIIGGFTGAILAGGSQGIDWVALPAGFLLSFFAQGGDLLESAIKRKLGVKDSGRTIPGHGGLFDRLDGFLAAAPVAAILVLSVQGGLPLWG
jgi:phosphatidate cytidylyltransferase